MSKVASFKGIDVVIRTRDEHCEPHVHAFHVGQGWELRVFFSYVSDEIIDVELLHGKLPKQAVVQTIMDKVIDHLDKAREFFWDAVHNVCLDNQYIVVANGVARSATQDIKDAVLVKTARYIPTSGSIECRVSSTTPLIAKCP